MNIDDLRCHNFDLDSPLDRETGLDIFKVDPEYEQHEAEYKVTSNAPLSARCIFDNIAQLKYSFTNEHTMVPSTRSHEVISSAANFVP